MLRSHSVSGTITENGTSYSFGYALIRNQQRIRLKIGDDGEILEDVGTALDAEKELLADMNRPPKVYRYGAEVICGG
ncbi:MAG: hypothetical protein AAF215_27465 [Cyanobacteria bacterium P01_A01_bin.123]